MVPRNHHDENRTMSNSAGAGPEPPPGAGGPVPLITISAGSPDCELYNKRVLLIVPSDDTCSKAPNFRLRRSE